MGPPRQPFDQGDIIRGMGRPTKLTPVLQERLISVIRRGHYISTACQAAGISKEALSQWRERAARGEELYMAFVAAAEKARAEAEITLFDRVISAAELPGAQGWLPAITALERSRPERYGRQDRLLEGRTLVEIEVRVLYVNPPPQPLLEGEVLELPPGASDDDATSTSVP